MLTLPRLERSLTRGTVRQAGGDSCYLCAKNFHNRYKFDKVLPKNEFAQFFETRCMCVGLILTSVAIGLICFCNGERR